MCRGFRKHPRVWAFCLATLFASYYAATALFAHVHVVNGVMLVHSHPFTKSHSHNDGQTLALHFLSSFHSLEAGQTDLELPNLYVLYSLVENWKSLLSCLLMRQEFISVLLPYDSSIGDLKNLV